MNLTEIRPSLNSLNLFSKYFDFFIINLEIIIDKIKNEINIIIDFENRFF